ncbi:hypothetical protein BKI52_43720 [marine bacterium AO1-C]|nr:hypothetical protein BKI52_43720 [marine bacterium AO1-C]
MRKIRLIIVGLLYLQAITFVQAQEILTELIKENHYNIQPTKESFSGKGWEKVLQAAQKHKYFLIGEDHGFAEVPKLTAALAKQVNYQVFVSEIDSVTASLMQELAQKSAADIQQFHQQNPSALSFYSAVEEFELAKLLAKQGAAFWGLDQVSLFSTGLVLRQLAKKASGKKVKSLALQLSEKSDNLFRESAKTGKYDNIFIFSTPKSTLDQLEKACVNENAQAKALLRELLITWKIYNKAGHKRRIAHMKQKLLNYYFAQRSKAQKGSKVLFKFGANHVAKGKSLLSSYDIGNLLANLAHAENEQTYHLMIVGKTGVANSFLPTKGMNQTRFDIANKKNPLNGLTPFYGQLKQEGWAFFDLKPIRKKLNKKRVFVKSKILERVIQGYDGLIIIPEVQASHLLPKR